jgi:hypothetical protein
MAKMVSVIGGTWEMILLGDVSIVTWRPASSVNVPGVNWGWQPAKAAVNRDTVAAIADTISSFFKGVLLLLASESRCCSEKQ